MSLTEIFKTMDYGPAPESAAAVNAWLDQHDRQFGLFINNQWVTPEGIGFYASYDPATGEKLADTAQAGQEEVDTAVAAARKAYGTWSKTPGNVRSRYLYAIARNIQKHHRLLAVLESMDNGKPIRESRDIDVPLLARHFYYHAGWAQLMDTELADYQPVGVIGQIIPWNFPLLMLAWKIAPAIAMGNTVVLKPASYTALVGAAVRRNRGRSRPAAGRGQCDHRQQQGGIDDRGPSGCGQNRLHRLDRSRPYFAPPDGRLRQEALAGIGRQIAFRRLR